MKKVILFSMILICYHLTGCKKFLEATPQDFVAPENYFTKEQDAFLALNAAFDELTRQWFYAGYYQARMVADCDDVYCALTGVYPANHKAIATDVAFANVWQVLYQTVERCNIVLANIDRVDMDETKRGYVKGEALFLRAYCFFFLVDHWGPIPLKLTPTKDANDISIPRSPIADVYKQILDDMTAAEALVPTTALADYGCAGYPAKTAVEGILARVCLTMAGAPLHDESKYADAKIWAQKVVDSKEHSLNPDYTDIFIKMASNQYDKKESLWEVDFIDVPGKTEHGYLGYLDGILCPVNELGRGAGQVRTTRLLYKLYENDDVRRDWNISTYTYSAAGNKAYSNGERYTGYAAKFRLEYSPTPRVVGRSPVNFPILRYSDILLMLAEADNEINGGPTPLAYSCMNKVRARAYGKLLPGATDLNEADLPAGLDQLSFRKVIQDERCREFPSEALRRHDLIRWGIYLSTLQAMKADVTDTGQPAVNSSLKARIVSLVNNASTTYLLWPIPGSELSLNREMTQNPGW